MIQLRYAREHGGVPHPYYATDGAAAFDLVIDNDRGLALDPGSRNKVSTGLYLEIPAGYGGLLLPRSSVANLGLSFANAIGLIDSDYRGVVGLVLVNNTSEVTVLMPYQRVAQMVVVPIPRFDLAEVQLSELSQTKRGAGGFGSTGA